MGTCVHIHGYVCAESGRDGRCRGRTEVSAAQSYAHTIAVGVAFAEKTDEDDEPWRDLDTGHAWVCRGTLRVLGNPKRHSRNRRGRNKSRKIHDDATSPTLPPILRRRRLRAILAFILRMAARESVAMAHPRGPLRVPPARDRGAGKREDRADDGRARLKLLACASGNMPPSRFRLSHRLRRFTTTKPTCTTK